MAGSYGHLGAHLDRRMLFTAFIRMRDCHKTVAGYVCGHAVFLMRM